VGDERRAPGLQRVPLVQRCRVELDSGEGRSAFLVNISLIGAYVAEDEQPALGARGRCVLQLPGNALDISLPCTVVWVNPSQQHPIHSLPPGYGVSFHELEPTTRARIEELIQGYLARSARRGDPGRS
jgi:Tfp pilus assembly protein PilZ